MVDVEPNQHVVDTMQFFARWRYEKVDDTGMFDVNDGEVIDGYRRIDNITDEAPTAFTAAYPGESISKNDIFEYVYGLLHSPEYRETYAADLKKMLPPHPLRGQLPRLRRRGQATGRATPGVRVRRAVPAGGA